MARKVSIPKPNLVELSVERPLSVEVRALILTTAAIENSVLPPVQRTGTNIQSIKTDVEGLDYIGKVNARVYQQRYEDKTRFIGAIFGLLTFLFFASLVFAAVFGKPVPPEARLLVIAVLALGVALSLGFLGGSASASGKLENLLGNISPIAFKVGGGVAVFVIVFLIGYIVYVKPGDDRVTLVGSVVDANTSHGVPATIIIKTDANTYERQATDYGDFRISDIPHLFNQEILVTAKADNYRSHNAQTVLVDSFVLHFRLIVDNCYNGVWHEKLSNNNMSLRWRFKLTGKSLHIARLDGQGYGDFHSEAGTWIGTLPGAGAKATTIVLSVPNETCNEIVTNNKRSFIRDTFE